MERAECFIFLRWRGGHFEDRPSVQNELDSGISCAHTLITWSIGSADVHLKALQIEFIGQRIRMSIRFNVRLFNSGRQLALRDTDNRQGSVSDSFIISWPAAERAGEMWNNWLPHLNFYWAFKQIIFTLKKLIRRFSSSTSNRDDSDLWNVLISLICDNI